ncbi:MAG: isoprenylcysteine carboxylmethyltransferase family protein [Planctomycetota bacterium]|jgi:protein-S-isoprenylcysteine O-methyltransferase Ste14|nr:isoprenylcysteine carboxylmethyltransferase family protein [Planctomycetota bacterium]
MSANNRASKRLTWRKSAVYICGLLLVSLADPRPVTFAIGCVLVAFAWFLRLWAFGHLDKNQLLVTTGPYAHMRNPAYFGTFLAMLGVALAAGNHETTRGQVVYGFAVVLAVVFFTFYLPRKMKREYPRLQKLFGAEVDRHAQNVPDFWPRLTPWKSGQQRSFSWEMVRENHELSWGFALAVVMLLVWFAHLWSPFVLTGAVT